MIVMMMVIIFIGLSVAVDIRTCGTSDYYLKNNMKINDRDFKAWSKILWKL